MVVYGILLAVPTLNEGRRRWGTAMHPDGQSFRCSRAVFAKNYQRELVASMIFVQDSAASHEKQKHWLWEHLAGATPPLYLSPRIGGVLLAVTSCGDFHFAVRGRFILDAIGFPWSQPF